MPLALNPPHNSPERTTSKGTISLTIMQKQLQEVLEFHQKFDVYSNTTPTINLPHDAYLLRKHIMQEEVSEYSEEYEREGLSDDERLQAVAKELADIIYTALGTVIAHGLQDKFEQIFDAVHQSNMSKLDAAGKPVRRPDGKVIKSDLYQAPDLSFLKQND